MAGRVLHGEGGPGTHGASVQNSEAMALSAALLAVAGELTQRIHEGVVARGFAELRPAHGFAFARLVPDGATVSDLAAHLAPTASAAAASAARVHSRPLGVTKQAASQLVDKIRAQGVCRAAAASGGRAGAADRADRAVTGGQPAMAAGSFTRA